MNEKLDPIDFIQMMARDTNYTIDPAQRRMASDFLSSGNPLGDTVSREENKRSVQGLLQELEAAQLARDDAQASNEQLTQKLAEAERMQKEYSDTNFRQAQKINELTARGNVLYNELAKELDYNLESDENPTLLDGIKKIKNERDEANRQLYGEIEKNRYLDSLAARPEWDNLITQLNIRLLNGVMYTKDYVLKMVNEISNPTPPAVEWREPTNAELGDNGMPGRYFASDSCWDCIVKHVYDTANNAIPRFLVDMGEGRHVWVHKAEISATEARGE